MTSKRGNRGGNGGGEKGIHSGTNPQSSLFSTETNNYFKKLIGIREVKKKAPPNRKQPGCQRSEEIPGQATNLWGVRLTRLWERVTDKVGRTKSKGPSTNVATGSGKAKVLKTSEASKTSGEADEKGHRNPRTRKSLNFHVGEKKNWGWRGKVGIGKKFGEKEVANQEAVPPDFRSGCCGTILSSRV